MVLTSCHVQAAPPWAAEGQWWGCMRAHWRSCLIMISLGAATCRGAAMAVVASCCPPPISSILPSPSLSTYKVNLTATYSMLCFEQMLTCMLQRIGLYQWLNMSRLICCFISMLFTCLLLNIRSYLGVLNPTCPGFDVEKSTLLQTCLSGQIILMFHCLLQQETFGECSVHLGACECRIASSNMQQKKPEHSSCIALDVSVHCQQLPAVSCAYLVAYQLDAVCCSATPFSSAVVSH